jgi:hypothetical protein
MSFGMAPAFLLVKMCPFTSVHNQAWIIAAVFVPRRAAAGRGSMSMDEEDDHTMFAGSPAAAAVIASFDPLLSAAERRSAGKFFWLRPADAATVAAVCGGDRNFDGVADSVSLSAVSLISGSGALRTWWRCCSLLGLCGLWGLMRCRCCVDVRAALPPKRGPGPASPSKKEPLF